MTNNHLMHPRVAHNHISNGYFPTDLQTMRAIASHLDIAGDQVRIFDPCCGEGDALAYLSNHIQECGACCTSFGIELDKDRANISKQKLDQVLHANLENSLFASNAVGLLFLNPPYGFSTHDDLTSIQRSKRIEEQFFERTIGSLQHGGVMVLLIPTSSLNESFAYEIASNFIKVQIFKACVDTYKQVVIIGVKPFRRSSIGKKQIQSQQNVLLQWECSAVISSEASTIYEIPQIPKKSFNPISYLIDAEGLREELGCNIEPTLWVQFDMLFSESLTYEKRRPLCALGVWHTALALAAGQVDGVVHDRCGRQLLVKGSTHKVKVVHTQEELDNKGNPIVVSTHLDRFVPCICAIDLTLDSVNYGNILTIQ